jgi:endoglucanase
VLAVVAGVSACGSAAPPRSGTTGAAVRFLGRYVTGDGRVIRRDQGGDIVSEGQAYGMLIAELAGRPALARAIWSWTESHLKQPDGLFAWHATGSGQIVDPQSAADADILIAYALLRYAGPDEGRLHSAGRGVAAAILAHEAVRLASGAPVVTAGPWATSTSPPTINPSYLMPGVFAALASRTHDSRWQRAADSAVRLIAELTAGGARLPPDWATLTNGRLVAAAAPGGSAGIQYGEDAARTPVWFASACDPLARRLAARWWTNVLQGTGRAGALALSQAGGTINPQPVPLGYVAAAGAARAAGDAGAAARLRATAAALAQRVPTYYGDAWAALGPAVLDGVLAPCHAAITN